jgi:plastocyanin
MPTGATFTYRFLKAGTFDFICSYHDAGGMTGTITVKP